MTGVPTKAYRLPTEWVQPNTTLVNVASFKNVDEESLLKIPGVVYVPMVGKVTVAMLEHNLMRLYEQFPMKIVESENSSAQAIKQVESRVANLEENVNEIKSLLTNIQALLEKDK